MKKLILGDWRKVRQTDRPCPWCKKPLYAWDFQGYNELPKDAWTCCNCGLRYIYSDDDGNEKEVGTIDGRHVVVYVDCSFLIVWNEKPV